MAQMSIAFSNFFRKPLDFVHNPQKQRLELCYIPKFGTIERIAVDIFGQK